MNPCERCGRKPDPNSFDLFDYCARCCKNLCPACMAAGCCGHVPAESGMKADHDAEQGS